MIYRLFYKYFIFLCLTIISVQSLFAGTEKNSRTMLHMLDYVGRDYKNAVSKGEITNEFEYAEMLEFSIKTRDYFLKVSADTFISDSIDIIHKLDELILLVQDKADPKDVAQITSGIKNQILALGLLKQSAVFWPDLSKGEKLFRLLCSACHGEKGDGKGPASAGLNPAPTSFLDTSRTINLSPLQAFNTIRIGLQGTSMTAFDTLGDENTWALAFYILSIRHNNETVAGYDEVQKIVSLEDASTLSDFELQNKYGSEKQFSLPFVRWYSQKINPNSSTARAVELLKLSLDVYRSGKTDEAGELALRAYLEGIEPIEQSINASDANLVGEIENSMMLVRSGIKNQRNLSEVEKSVYDAIEVIGRAEEILGKQERSTSFTAFVSASILIREGLEAFLIIITMLTILRSLKAEKAIRWVHGGWITAVFSGLTGWFFVDKLMQWDIQSREFMEGFIALFAVAVLLYMGFWMHSKTSIGKWKKFIEEKIVVLVNKNNMFGLALFSFVVVFREAFESVIFLSSLSMDSENDTGNGILIGVMAAAVIVFLISWGILKLFDRIPLRKVFLYSSLIVLTLAVVLTGDGIHALQEGGLLNASPAPINLRLPVLGIFPTYECLLAQLLIFILITVLWKYSTEKSRVN